MILPSLFGSEDRSRTLAHLFGHPSQDFGVRELSRAVGVDPGLLSKWLKQWADAGVLRRTEEHKTRVRYAARTDPQSGLLPLVSFFFLQSPSGRAIAQQIELLGDKVGAAAVFGSTAAGTAGPGSDIDLLLLTDMPRVQSQAAFKAVGRAIGREVNVLAYQESAWSSMAKEGNPLVLDILSKNTVLFKGSLQPL